MSFFDFIAFITIVHIHELSIETQWSITEMAVVHQQLNDLIVTRHQCIKEIVRSVYKIDSYVWWSGNKYLWVLYSKLNMRLIAICQAT